MSYFCAIAIGEDKCSTVVECVCVGFFFFLDCSQESGSNLLPFSPVLPSQIRSLRGRVSQDGCFSGEWLLFSYLSLCVLTTSFNVHML